MISSDNPIKIIDNLYLGNFTAAIYDNLKKNNIAAVVCLSNDSHLYPKEVKLFHIDDISDNLDPDSFDIEKLQNAISFIEQEINKHHAVLVHCMAGISRSPTVIIAYLIKAKGCTVSEACNFVKSKANHINPTFMDLLEQYYYSLH
jgi:protein-tyrosine phosphatase